MKIKSIIPRRPKNTLSYISDYITALLPSLVFAAVFYTSSIITNVLISVAVTLALELVFSYVMQKEFDGTMMVRALVLCLCLPSNAPVWCYALGGGIVFILSTLRGFTDKYVTYEAVTISVLIILCFIQADTPSALALQGKTISDLSTLDLILGTKSHFFTGGCLICILFAFVYLAIRKRVSFFNSILFYAALVCVSGFLYTEGEINALHFVSLIALDPKIFFASLVLLTLGGALPFGKKSSGIAAVIGGAAAGAAMVYLGLESGVYYTVLIMSLLSRPIDILICKAYRKKS